LAGIQSDYEDTIAEIFKDTKAKLAELTQSLKDAAAALAELGAAKEALAAIENAPVYVPPVAKPYTLQDAMAKTGALSEREYMRESGGININQNISYPTASASEISAKTLSAIKFGTTSTAVM
jgi:hypothetical protein